MWLYVDMGNCGGVVRYLLVNWSTVWLRRGRIEGRTEKEGEGGRRGGGREWVITHEYISSVVTEYSIIYTYKCLPKILSIRSC